MDDSSVLQVEDSVLSQSNHALLCHPMSLPPAEPPAPRMPTSARGRAVVFTPEQKEVLMKYFEEYGMTSTHRRNTELMRQCAGEVGTTVARVKNWIGSEAVKRKRKAGILPRPKVEISGSETNPKIVSGPPAKKFKRVNGYNLFFSDCVRRNPEISTEFRERNAIVAQKWAALTENSRKEWAVKAEAACSAAVQDLQPSPMGMESQHRSSLSMNSDMTAEEALVEKTLVSIQEKFDLLEQLGFEGYCVLVNTTELQTHILATGKGKNFHKLRQQANKPLENPFIGFVFSDEAVALEQQSMASLDSLASGGSVSAAPSSSAAAAAANMQVMMAKRPGSTAAGGGAGGGASTGNGGGGGGGSYPGPSSLETMQKSVMNAFALKYKVATGRSDVPYDRLQALGVQVYGMPPGIPFHSPILYTQQQLQQILANLEKIVFLKVGSSILPVNSALSEVELSAHSLAAAAGHELSIGTEEEMRR